MIHHHYWQLVTQLAIRRKVLVPQLTSTPPDRRCLKMRVARATTQSRKVLSAPHDTMRCETAQKSACIFHHSRYRRSCGPRAHHLSRFRQPQVHHRRERCIEAECFHCLCNQLAMLPRRPGAFHPTADGCPILARFLRKGGKARVPHVSLLRHGIGVPRDSLCRGHRRQCIPQPVHRSAFHIHASQLVRRAQARSFVQ